MEQYIQLGIQYGLKLLGAIAILIVGFWVVKKVSKGMKKVLMKKDIDASLTTFLSSFVNVICKILVILVAIASVGIEMTSIVAIMGAASLAIGMALSGTFQNFAGGMVILFLKPFKVGDVIEAQGFTGTVSEILMFTTMIKTADNKCIFIPNGGLANGSIVNYTRTGTRRLDLTYNIAYGDNVERAREILTRLINEDKRIHTEPAPMIVLSSLADSAVHVSVRIWTNASDLFDVQFSLNEKVYAAFPAQGLSFPFPQVQVHTSGK